MIARDGGCVPLTDAQRDKAEEYLHFCDRAANRFAKKYPRVARDEFLSAAFEGLADAVKGFDESRSISPAYYARKRIAGACVDLMREGGHGAIRVSRKGYAAGLAPWVISIDTDVRAAHRDGAPSGDFFLPPDPGPSPDAAIAAHDQFEAMIGGLSSVGRFVLRKVYGPSAWSFHEIADYIGLSPTRIGQIHAAALPKVARRAVRLGLGDTPIVAEPARRRHRAAASLAPRVRCDSVVVEIDPAIAAALLLGSIRHGDRPPNWRTVARAAGSAGASDEDLATLDGLLAGLKPARRRVLELGYGLDGAMRPLGEVARLMGWSRQRVYYAQRMALEELGEMHHETK